MDFNTFRTILGYVVLGLLLAYPYFMHRKGRKFWQDRFVVKWIVFGVITWIVYLVLNFIVGLLIALGFSSYALAGGIYSLNLLYVALSSVYVLQIVIVIYLITRK